jgi:alpha-glucosidase
MIVQFNNHHMKKLLPALVLRIALATGFLAADNAVAETTTVISSPNQSVQFKFICHESRLSYEVRFRNRPVIESSLLALTVDGTNLTEGADAGEASRYELNETYPWRGVHAKATHHCHGATISLKHTKSTTAFQIEVRAFDDGAAFRYIVPGNAEARVPDEATSFTLPAGTVVWYHDLEGHYEAVHQKRDVADVASGQWIAPPLTMKLPDGAGYASITEAALVNYSGMALQADGQRGFKLRLGDKHPPSYPFRLRYKNDIERLAKPAAVSGTITSPWRVLMIGSDLNALVNSDIVHSLCPPPNLKLFPNGIATEWIKPGRAVWKYLDGGSNTFDEMKEFSRMAGELGFEYHVIEGFWSRWSDDQIKELADYSRQRGVGLWFWRHSRELRTPEARELFFKKLHDLGIVGAKIDFFDHEHKEVVDLYTALLEEAAKHQIMVNFHGANKPTGEPRTWPNELIREGVRGMESSRLQARALHNTTLPFTRYLAGHGDYTPVHFGARRGDTTWAHQVATAAVFNEPLLTYGAHPANILKNPCQPMITSIPAAWDETVVLPVSEIREVAAFARRSGTAWFLAILNGPSAKTLDVTLDFLKAGSYGASMICDRKDDSAAVDIVTSTVDRGAPLKIEMSAGGGFIGRFSPN